MPPTPDAEPELANLRPRWLTALDPNDYVLTRFVFLRFLGLMYTVAFLAAANQLVPLVGTGGLEPADRFLREVEKHLGPGDAFVRLPTLFWLGISDDALHFMSYAGLVLSLCVLFGLANAAVLFFLWLFYLSIVQVGQVFWGYGWESLLLETGFLAIFLAPPLDPRPFSRRDSPPKPVIWLLRWVVFRLMLGAGLIKLRGDECWRDLTCMVTHYETQPLPNPMSWLLHRLPLWVQKGSVLFNHYAELVAPFMIFGPRKVRIAGGISIVLFQLLLIVSGNLSWLNWLSITIAIACFDDAALVRLCPARFRDKLHELTAGTTPRSKPRKVAVYALCSVVGVLSLNPVVNLFSPTQRMNSSFDPLYLVNTYGAFGSIGRERYEIIIEGTADDDPNAARWASYEFRCKPGDVARRPCIVAPYQYRIDWQMWFAAMSDYRHHPWIVHLVYKLLSGDPGTLSLLAKNPFERPPKWIRAELYRYTFTKPGDPGNDWWARTHVATYLPPLSADDPNLLEFLHRHGWL